MSTKSKWLKEIQRPNTIIAALLGIIFLLLSEFLPENYTFTRTVCHEIGFALIVAVIIWITFELVSHYETDDIWTQRMENIAKNVFFGVFKKNFPPAFISEATELVLENSFIRSDLVVTYIITDGEYIDRAGVKKNYVRLQTTAKFKVQNVGNVTENFPIAISLPNPLIDELKPECKVLSIVASDRGQDTTYHLDSAEREFREAIKDDSKFSVPFSIKGGIDIEKDSEIELKFSYVMAKEEEDTEIFQTKYPTNSIDVTINDQSSTRRRLIRARSIHRCEMTYDGSNENLRSYNYKMNTYSLPYQGYVFWWKSAPPNRAPGHLQGP